MALDLDALDHETHMERALELAREAAERGDDPYGSTLVRAEDGSTLMEERNAVRSEDDIRRHPELTLAARAARELSAQARAGTVMYTSTEPCPMCSGGIAIAGLGGVVYAVSGSRATELGGGDAPPVPSEQVLESWGQDIPVVESVLEAEGEAIHRGYR